MNENRNDIDIEVGSDPKTPWGLIYRIAWIVGACFIAWTVCGR